ncbi:TniQ family protein [Microbacterium sp.]|uniref:TniQ family protein n=1 Tax=Microbacterium sp. TaxID=51671 RepID=UPI002811ECED|nr:TniQ family protein [Microbacterium sp.]
MITATTASVRPLPFRVRPLPDEPFDSWLEVMAAHYRATVGETAYALGLIERRDGRPASADETTVSGWTTQLSDEQAKGLALSTGIAEAQFHEMTRMWFARHMIRFTRTGRISNQCAAGVSGGRYCADCLLDSGGRWRMSWQFTLGFACLRHRRLLADFCPACGAPPRRRGHLLGQIPEPGRCHNSVQGGGRFSRHPCHADLTIGVETEPAPEGVLTAQRLMMRTMSTGEAHTGIYTGAPQPAVRVFEDIRLLSRVALRAITAGDTDVIATPGRDLVEHLRGHEAGAVGAAIGSAAAVGAIADPYQVVRLIRGRLAPNAVSTLCTPQLQALIAASFGRTRRPTAFLQSAPMSERNPADRARKVPARIWVAWMRLYGPTPMPGTRSVGREIIAVAMSAAVVFAGTRLTHSAALALIDPSAPVRQVTYVMRMLAGTDQDSTTALALLRLTAWLDDHDVPIDYARRRALDCRDLLVEEEWDQICHELNLTPGGGGRWRRARALLYRELTGNAARSADPKLTAVELDRFGDNLPASARDALNRVGLRFLAGRGINEPLTWAPPLEVSPEIAPEDSTGGGWPAARPAFAAVEEKLPLDEIVVGYVSGATTYELAEMAGVSRQTISRILADASTPTRRGRPVTVDIDVARVRHLYEVERKTMAQIADIMGCSPNTICRRLRD